MAAVGERQISYDARGLAEPVAEAPRTAVISRGRVVARTSPPRSVVVLGGREEPVTFTR